ncbi:Glutaredoxin [Blastocladiella emersonii ATCC 22665]|nr:Glutaredoxin [Blastocladiella emersonii ATCC 22665]
MGQLFSSAPADPEMASKVAATVAKLISDNAVMVFSKSYCPYCTKAKDALKAVGAAFHAIELDQMNEGAEIQAHLAELTGQRTVPNIFIKGKHIGGCSDLLELKSSGKLQSML